MVLSKRLETILLLGGRADTAADVGCDHGYVAIELVRRGHCRRAFAMDVRPGPLEAAKNHIREAGLSGLVEWRLSDGLEQLGPGEADLIIIAGMGGALIQDILDRGRECAAQASRLILSPQSELPAFRRYLNGNGFRILEEILIEEDGKIYSVFACEPGTELPWTEEEILFGRHPLTRRDPALLAQLEKKMHQIDGILRGLESADGERADGRRKDLKEERNRIAGVLSPERSADEAD